MGLAQKTSVNQADQERQNTSFIEANNQTQLLGLYPGLGWECDSEDTNVFKDLPY